MSMSKQDIALADVIREFNAECGNDQFAFTEQQIIALGEFCRDQNPRFMRDRWLDYIAGKCGKNGGAIKKSSSPTCRNCGQEWLPDHKCA